MTPLGRFGLGAARIGERGSDGRPPSRIRHALRPVLRGSYPVARRDRGRAGGKTTVGDRLRALDILAKYGLGADRSRHDEELVRLLAQVTAKVLAGDVRLEGAARCPGSG